MERVDESILGRWRMFMFVVMSGDRSLMGLKLVSVCGKRCHEGYFSRLVVRRRLGHFLCSVKHVNGNHNLK